MRQRTSQHWRSQLVWGAVLIGGGLLLLLDQMNIVDVDLFRLWTWWPALVAVFGAVKLVPPTTVKQVLNGLWLIFFALWWYVSYDAVWGLSFWNSWPFLVIAMGAGLVLEPLLVRFTQQKPEAGHGQ